MPSAGPLESTGDRILGCLLGGALGDRLLARGVDRHEARAVVRGGVQQVMDGWR